MPRSVFALVVDVMGVQQDLLSTGAEATERFDRCRERLEDFRRDLFILINQQLPLLLLRSDVPEPHFVAEFSDSAYIVGDCLASVAVPAIYLMRQALRHRYPLRGGLGFGTFSHESSGVRANQNRQVWTTSSFLGSAIVTAYQAERTATPGLRIFVHPTVAEAWKSERYCERRKIEIVNSFGANSAESFERVVLAESGQTFRKQAEVWLKQCMTRKRRPVKPATVRGWESYLDNHLNPLIGDTLLANVTNSTLKSVVTHLSAANLSAKTIRNVVQAMTMVVASAVDENGDKVYPRKWNYEFADLPIVGNQRTPMFTGESITKIIAEVEGQERAVLILFASSGLRAGELFGLEVKHFSGNTLTVEQSVWEGNIQTPKTKNAYRQVDLHPSVTAWLRSFIGDRQDGFIFSSSEGTAIHQSNFLRRALHPTLEKLGIEKQGFHGFRRFRVTHLESNFLPAALIKYWTDHAKSSDGDVQQVVTDRYVKMAKDTKFRADVAERIGLGFKLPKPVVVPSVPSEQEKEVAASR